MTTEAVKIGRPMLYKRETAEEICRRLGNGESLVYICQDKEMPSEETVYNWLRGINCEETSLFLKMYKRARKNQGDAYADATVKIADDLDRIEDNQQSEFFGSFLSAKTRVAEVRIKARQWHAARLRPRKYGDQLTTNNKTKLDAKLDLTNAEDVRDKLRAKLTPTPVVNDTLTDAK